jgi:hypothetical protein
MVSIPSDLSDPETAQITVKVPIRDKEKMLEIAHEESTPHNRLTMSDVARAAIRDMIQQFDKGQGDENSETEEVEA